MKCPLFMAAVFTHQRLYGEGGADCLREECAWWEPSDGQCSIKVIAEFIAGMGMNIRDIKDKMPDRERLV